MVDERPTESAERYLEAVYILERTQGAIAARVAERLAIRPPSVTQALRRLEAAGWLEVGPDRSLRLTAGGTRLAEQVMRRHRVLERWLVEGLGMPWARAHSESQRMEHAVSPEVVDRLYEAMGRPTTCPHGNPIPGEAGLPAYAGSATLADVAARRGRGIAPDGGAREDGPASAGEPEFHVARIAEDAEESADALALFDDLGLRPGVAVEVLDSADHDLRVRVDGRAASLPKPLAAKVWVERARTRS